MRTVLDGRGITWVKSLNVLSVGLLFFAFQPSFVAFVAFVASVAFVSTNPK